MQICCFALSRLYKIKIEFMACAYRFREQMCLAHYLSVAMTCAIYDSHIIERVLCFVFDSMNKCLWAYEGYVFRCQSISMR